MTKVERYYASNLKAAALHAADISLPENYVQLLEKDCVEFFRQLCKLDPFNFQLRFFAEFCTDEKVDFPNGPQIAFFWTILNSNLAGSQNNDYHEDETQYAIQRHLDSFKFGRVGILKIDDPKKLKLYNFSEPWRNLLQEEHKRLRKIASDNDRLVQFGTIFDTTRTVLTKVLDWSIPELTNYAASYAGYLAVRDHIGIEEQIFKWQPVGDLYLDSLWPIGVMERPRFFGILGKRLKPKFVVISSKALTH